MFCPQCGEQLEGRPQFCPHCGAPLQMRDQAQTTPTGDASDPDSLGEKNVRQDPDAAKHPKRKRTVLVVTALVLIALVVGGALVVPRFMRTGEDASIVEQSVPEQSGEGEEGDQEGDSEAPVEGPADEDAPEDSGTDDEVEFSYVNGKGMVSSNAVAITDLTWEKVDQNQQLPAPLREDAYNFRREDAYLVTFNAENLTDKSLESQIKFKATQTKADSKGNTATNETTFLSADATGQVSWTRGVLGTFDQGWFFLAPHEKREVELYTTWVDAKDRDPSPSVAVLDNVTYVGCESSECTSLLPLTDETIKLENGTGACDYMPTNGDSVYRGAAFSVTNTTKLRMRSLVVIYGYRYGDTFAPALFYRELSDIAPGDTVVVRPDEAVGRGSGERIPVSDLFEELQVVPIAVQYVNK